MLFRGLSKLLFYDYASIWKKLHSFFQPVVTLTIKAFLGIKQNIEF